MRRRLYAAGVCWPRTRTAEAARQIARCNAEIEAMLRQPEGPPAWLTTLGIEDWRAEKRLIRAEQKAMAADAGGMSNANPC